MTVWLSCAGMRIGASAELLELSRPRVHFGPFVTQSDERPALTLERVSSMPEGEGVALDGSLSPWGFWSRQGNVMKVHLPDDTYGAESVLRIAWQLATAQQGGVLMHGCGVAWGQAGVAAIGHSGAGKSTLANLTSQAPGHATLLTDEIVQLLPEGFLVGTPFRSNPECVGAPRMVRLASLLLLEKGPHEALAAVDGALAAPELLGQLYKAVEPKSQQSQVRFVLALIDLVGVRRLTFRKDPAVGPFLRQFVENAGGIKNC